jgi:hypothetical protein
MKVPSELMFARCGVHTLALENNELVLARACLGFQTIQDEL